MVADPAQVTDAELDAWAADLDSWDVCDGLCSSLLVRVPQRWELVERYAARAAGFEKRAGFALAEGAAPSRSTTRRRRTMPSAPGCR